MKNDTVAIVGLGYVGLPLAVAFGRLRRTIGLDLNEEIPETLYRVIAEILAFAFNLEGRTPEDAGQPPNRS